jgi:protein-disulfide isomerase
MTVRAKVRAMSKILILAAVMAIVAAPAAPVLTAYQGAEQPMGGTLNAPIRLEVFSDFQCPSCKVFYLDTVRPVLKNYCITDKVCVIYREFPLPMHPLAREAARLSTAARKLGQRQWLAVFDAIYSEQDIWTKSGMIQATVARALSSEDFQKLLVLAQDPSINQAIERDIALGKKRQVDQTPTFFVSALGREQKIVGGLPYATLKDFFDKVVK